MKKHWVEFTAIIFGSILVEGDETPDEASSYVKKHLDITCEAEGVDGEINEKRIVVENAYQD
jgi:hypothetical protein